MRKTTKQLLGSLKRALPLSLGAVFLSAGLAKLANLQDFHDSLANLPFLDGTMAGIVSILIPNVEVTLGACLILGNHSRAIYTTMALLSLCFLLVTMYWFQYGIQSNCGCFGSATAGVGNKTWMLPRNFALLAASVTACY